MITLSCPYKNEDNDYIIISWNSWYGYIDFSCEIRAQMHKNPLIMRISDYILKEGGELEDAYSFNGYSNHQLNKILQDKLDELCSDCFDVCLYIKECNNYCLEKYYKYIRSLLI